MDDRIGDEARHPLNVRPWSATQHVTAGPYSPAFKGDAHHLVVISGQMAVVIDVVGDTIEEQAAATLRKCANQLGDRRLRLARCLQGQHLPLLSQPLARLNAVCERMMVEPLPVRTAVPAVLLSGFLLEIEMWAVAAKGA